MRYHRILSTWMCCIVFLLVILPTPAASQVPDTLFLNLRQAVDRALKVSPEVGEAASGESFAEARWQFARAHRYLSEFTATSAHSTSPGLDNPNGTPTDRLYLDPDVRNDWLDLSVFNRLEIKAVQPVFTWGEVSGNIRAAAYGIDVENASVHVKEIEVSARTGELYYGLLLTEALSRLTTEAGDVVKKAIDEIERMLDEGDEGVDDADLFQVQITQQDFNRRAVEVEQKRLTAQSALARQLLIPIGTTVKTSTTLLEPLSYALLSLQEYAAIAITNRPEIEQVDAGLKARTALVSVARSDYYPKLFLAVNANYSSAPDRFRQLNPYVGDPFLKRGVLAGFGFKQNLNFFQSKARVEQARSEADKVRYQGDAVHQLILFEVEEAYRNVLIAHAAMDAQKEALRLSKEWLRTEQVNFDLDLGDTENLVKAVRTNLELQAKHHQSVHDYNISIIRLMKATGTLSASLKNGTFVD